MNKNIIKFLYGTAFLAIICVSCFRIDGIDNNTYVPQNIENAERELTYTSPSEVLINGREFRQCELELGKFGGEFISSTIGEGPKTFNPWAAKDSTSTVITSMMFAPLFDTDAVTGEIIPSMAKSFVLSPDNKTYTVTLRKGMRWSDGKEITADDVVFTWNKIILAGYGNTSLRDSVTIDGRLPKVEKINRYTVSFSTIKPFAPFLRLMSEVIAPEHVVAPVLKKGKRAFESFWGTTAKPSEFVTSGPFTLGEYVPAQRVVLNRSKNYFEVDKKGRQLPYIDKYVIQIVGDLNNDLLKFEAGEHDLISIRGKDASRFKLNESKGDYTVYDLGPDTGTVFLTFNQNNRKDKSGKYYVSPVKSKWFRDKNFRTAADYAIDRKSIVANILDGVGSPLFTPEPLGCIFLNEKIAKGHERDIITAEQYLKKSGFYKDKSGQLFDKNGNKVEFDLLTNAGNTEREAVGVLIKEDLSELGMKVNFKPVEFNTLIGKTVNSYDWDAMVMGFTGSTLEPHGGKNVWYSDGPLHIYNQRNEDSLGVGVSEVEKKIDRLFDAAAAETDFEKRKKLYDEYQALVYDDKPFVYLYSAKRTVGIRNRFGNVRPTVIGGGIHNPAEIYLK